MTLSPEEISGREFTVRMRGYDQDEVRSFLDAAAKAVQDVARRTSNEMLREAETQAKEILADAERAVGHRMVEITRREKRLEDILNSTRGQLHSLFTLLLSDRPSGTFVEPLRSAPSAAAFLDGPASGLIALEDLFRLAGVVRTTGRLDLVFADGWGKVFFETGQVAYSESSLPREPLGEKLVHAGLVTEDQIREALERQSSSHQQVGQILISAGVVTLDQLAAALRAQIAEAVAPFLKRPLGDFTWTPSEHITLGVPVAITVEDIIGSTNLRELPSMGLF